MLSARCGSRRSGVRGASRSTDRYGRLHAHHQFQRSRGCTGGPRLQALQRHGDGQEGDGRSEEGRLGLEVRLEVQRADRVAVARQSVRVQVVPAECGRPSSDSTTASQSGNTAAAGTLDFVWRPTSATALSNITISETPVPAGFEAESVTCTSAGTNIFDSDVPATVASFTLSGLKVRDHVNCVVRNRFKRSTVRVVKEWVGDPGSTTIFVDATGAPPYDASTVATMSGASASFDYPVRPTWGSARPRCRPVTGPRSSAEARGPRWPTTAVPPGHVPGRGRRHRHLHDRQHPESLDRPGGQAVGGHALLGDNLRRRERLVAVRRLDRRDREGQSASFTTRPRPRSPSGRSPCRTDTAPRFSAPRDPQPYTGGPFPVTAPALPDVTLTCTITNKLKRSTVRVVKQWDGEPSSTTIFVDQEGTAPYEDSTLATADGDEASVVYAVGTPTTVGETPIPAGYTSTIDCGLGPSRTKAARSRSLPRPSTTILTCTITNKQLFSTVRVVKQWDGVPASTTFRRPGRGGAAVRHGVSIPLTRRAPPSSTRCRLPWRSARPGPRRLLGDDRLRRGPEATKAVRSPVTSPATDGATLTCTITNTQLFSTVRVVKEWLGLPSSATIFVDQNGIDSVRRLKGRHRERRQRLVRLPAPP